MKHRLTSTAGYAAMFAAFGTFALLSASAQQVAGQASATVQPVYLASAAVPATDALSSSSSVGESSSAGEAALPESPTQPPPRPRYSRPTYHDSNSNSDGSSKYTFVGGAGVSIPMSTTSNDLTPGYRVQVGGGRNFNKHFGVLLQFDYDHFGFQTTTLNTLLAIYNNPNDPGTGGAGLTTLGGSSHVWSFTLNPIYNITQGDKWGSYVVAGAGFYHKVADFTTPGTGEECSIYYGCFQYEANETIDSYVSNAPGFNGGGGLTYRLSRFSAEKLFMEARYVYVDNSARSYVGTTTANENGTAFDAFPQNGNHTTYLPITFGIRW